MLVFPHQKYYNVPVLPSCSIFHVSSSDVAIVNMLEEFFGSNWIYANLCCNGISTDITAKLNKIKKSANDIEVRKMKAA
jgi:hypothetical protein